jgi:hypothetical protein
MPPPRNVLTDNTPTDVRPVVDRDRDIIVPSRNWRAKVPPELAKEIAGRRRYDAAVRDALKDPETSQRFLEQPTVVLDDLKIPLSPPLRDRLNGRTGMDALSVSHRLRLPGNRIITPKVTAQVQDESIPAPHPPSVSPVIRLWNPLANLFKATGTLNHGYPVVYEITRACIHDLIAQWFDRGHLSDMLTALTAQVTDPVLQVPIQLAKLAYLV